MATTAFDSAVVSFDSNTTLFDGVSSSSSLIDVLIEIGTPTTALTSPTTFTLDHLTLSILNGTNLLAPRHTYTDITAYCSDYSINRGVNRELQSISAGSASITLQNQTRYLDPTNTASIFYPHIAPNSMLRISVDGQVQFTGHIDNFEVMSSGPRASTISVTAADSLSLLATLEFVWNTTSTQVAGKRIAALMGMTGFGERIPGLYMDGHVLMNSGAISGNLLSTLVSIAAVDRGKLFVNKSGVLVYLARTYNPNAGAMAVLSDVGSEWAIPYSDYKVQYGIEMLYNHCSVTRETSPYETVEQVSQSKSNTDSIERFGYRSYTPAVTPNAYDSDSLDYAAWIVATYGVPSIRFSSVTIPLNTLSYTLKAIALSIEIGSVLDIYRTPPGVGTPTQISQVCEVIGVHITRKGLDVTELTLSLQPSPVWTTLVLDHPVHSILFDTPNTARLS